MNAQTNWRDQIDHADQIHTLRAVLSDLASAIDGLEESPYADEDAMREQLHELELLHEYGEHKLARMLD